MTFLSAYLESALKQFVLKWLADKYKLEALAKLIPIVSSEKVAHFLWSSTPIQIRTRIPYFVLSNGLPMTVQLRSMERHTLRPASSFIPLPLSFESSFRSYASRPFRGSSIVPYPSAFYLLKNSVLWIFSLTTIPEHCYTCCAKT